MNVSTGTSANSTSSSYTPYSVPLRGEGITVSGAPNEKKSSKPLKHSSVKRILVFKR